MAREAALRDGARGGTTRWRARRYYEMAREAALRDGARGGRSAAPRGGSGCRDDRSGCRDEAEIGHLVRRQAVRHQPVALQDRDAPRDPVLAELAERPAVRRRRVRL